MGKSSINGPFSMAMLNNQRVDHKFHGSKRPVLMAFLPVKRTREILGSRGEQPPRGDHCQATLLRHLGVFLSSDLGISLNVYKYIYICNVYKYIYIL